MASPQPELTCTLIYHGMHAAVDNLEHNTEYTSQTLGALLYRQFTQIIKLTRLLNNEYSGLLI